MEGQIGVVSTGKGVRVRRASRTLTAAGPPQAPSEDALVCPDCAGLVPTSLLADQLPVCPTCRTVLDVDVNLRGEVESG